MDNASALENLSAGAGSSLSTEAPTATSGSTVLDSTQALLDFGDSCSDKEGTLGVPEGAEAKSEDMHGAQSLQLDTEDAGSGCARGSKRKLSLGMNTPTDAHNMEDIHDTTKGLDDFLESVKRFRVKVIAQGLEKFGWSPCMPKWMPESMDIIANRSRFYQFMEGISRLDGRACAGFMSLPFTKHSRGAKEPTTSCITPWGDPMLITPCMDAECVLCLAQQHCLSFGRWGPWACQNFSRTSSDFRISTTEAEVLCRSEQGCSSCKLLGVLNQPDDWWELGRPHTFEPHKGDSLDNTSPGVQLVEGRSYAIQSRLPFRIATGPAPLPARAKGIIEVASSSEDEVDRMKDSEAPPRVGDARHSPPEATGATSLQGNP
jgi:hypothetical protein